MTPCQIGERPCEAWGTCFSSKIERPRWRSIHLSGQSPEHQCCKTSHGFNMTSQQNSTPVISLLVQFNCILYMQVVQAVHTLKWACLMRSVYIISFKICQLFGTAGAASVLQRSLTLQPLPFSSLQRFASHSASTLLIESNRCLWRMSGHNARIESVLFCSCLGKPCSALQVSRAMTCAGKNGC